MNYTDMTPIVELLEIQGDKLDTIILNLNRLYYLGLFGLSVSAALFVILVLYNAFKKLI